MRRIIACFLLFLCVFVVYGTTQCDSLKVYFALNKAGFDPELDNNASSMEKFIDGLAASANSGTIDQISVFGYASPEGSFLNNERLSIQRCNAIADYISSRTGIALNDIHTSPRCIAWDGLRTLVIENPHTPSRNQVLAIIDEYLPEACTDQAVSDQCRKSLMAINNGHAYKWMLDNLFPKLRFSLIIHTFYPPDCSEVQSIVEDTALDFKTPSEGADLPADSIAITPDSVPSFKENNSAESHQPLHRLAIKTNFLYDAALLPNIELEWRINNKWSVALEGGIAWWGKYSKEKSFRLALVSPEVRRWVWTRTPWHGLYVGLFAGGALYDFQNVGPGYRGEAAMGGLSFGYMWPVSRCLSLEAELGAGYLFTRYKEYKSMDGHHVYQQTKDLNYFGPLKVKFSLVWRLWDLNKRGNTKQLVDQYEK